MKQTYCVCGNFSTGPRVVVARNGAEHHSREKCVTYGYDSDGKRSVVRYISTSQGLEIPATEVRS